MTPYPKWAIGKTLTGPQRVEWTPYVVVRDGKLVVEYVNSNTGEARVFSGLVPVPRKGD